MDHRELPADDQDDALDEQEIEDAWVRFAEEERDSLMAPPHLEEDRLSFEDSERFEDDESFVSESESLNNKWRGWSSRQNQAPNDDSGPHDARTDAGRSSSARIGSGTSLAELSARKAAKTLSFDLLESRYQTLKPGSRIPDSLLIPILRYCFPDNEEDIRLYSCLTNGHALFYSRGELLFQREAVKNVIQIGYHISAVVASAVGNDAQARTEDDCCDVTLRVDRCRIVECSCSCASTSAWCEHVVALCLHRMYKPETVEFRPTVWDSITELEDNKLKKFAQYLLNELPRKYLPVAQRLIDQLRDPSSEINQATGAPDPTAGEHDDVAIWCLDERNLHENIKKILISFVKPSPTVCDVQHLSSAYPPTSDEWNLLMKPLRSREPNALWNLLSIVEEMFKRNDENATILLHAITEHCIAVPQMLTWWYQTSLLRSGSWRLNASCYKSHLHALMSSTQYNAGFLCDHIVQLWRLAALNPRLTCFEKDQLASLLQMYHQTVVRRLWKIIPNLTADHYNSINIVDDTCRKLSQETASFDPDHFPAFLPAMRACYLEWNCDTIRDFITANDLTRLELELTEAGFFFVLCTKETVTPKFQSRTTTPDVCANIPLLRCGIEDLKDAFDDGMRITTSVNINDLFSGQRKPKKHKKRRKHRGSRQRGPGLPSTSRHAASVPVRSAIQEAMSDDSGDEGCAETSVGASARKEPFDDNVQLVFATAHLPHDPLDEKYAFCVGLAAHGFCTESFHMAVELATGLITDIPSTLFDISPSLLSQAFSLEPSSKRRWNLTKPVNECVAQIRRVVLPDMVRNSQVAEELLIKASFLVKTLCDTSAGNDSSLLAMQLALKVLSNARGPAGTRHHEVAIHYLEEELFRAVHKIPIGPNELQYLRQFANDLMSRATHSVPQRITVPASLTAHYLLDALSCSTVLGATVNAGRHSATVAPPVMTPTALSMRKPTDDDLALAVALDVLSKHVFVSEMDHPMLCECIRRQRGDLSMTLLLRYKDSVDKLGYVMDRILDPRIHRIYEDHKSNAAYFIERSSTTGDRFLLLLLESGAAYASTEEPVEEEELAKEVTDKLVCYADSQKALRSDVLPGKVERRRNTDESSSGDSRDANSPRLSDTNSSDTFRESYCVSDYAKTTSSQSPVSMMSLNEAHQSRRPRSLPTFPCASEAQAHFMMEFAKRILSEAGGNQSATIFNPIQNNAGQAATGIHRNLHLCSFLTGLYALGLNNLISPSWQTRTYSTHVSWIKSQAQEIGIPAIEILRRTWEKHLTPSETAELADKLGQSVDPTLVDEAALLAASVLPKAYALEYTQSQKALNQCRDHSAKLLEKACVAVEKAAERDGVHPDVLFQVARHWFQLHNDAVDSTAAGPSHHAQFAGHAAMPMQQPPHPAAFNVAVPPPPHPVHHGSLMANQFPQGMPPRYQAPAYPAQQVYALQQQPRQALHQSHSAPNLQPGASQMPHVLGNHVYGPNRGVMAYPQPDFTRAPPPAPMQQVSIAGVHHMPPNVAHNVHQRFGVSAQVPMVSTSHAQQYPPGGHQYQHSMSHDNRKAKLINAHRVGLRALDTLAYRPPDDNRCYVKFSQNPKYGDDIRWLYDISVELGIPYVNAFCEKAASSAASPFILLHLVKQSAQFFQWAASRYPYASFSASATSDFSQRATTSAQRPTSTAASGSGSGRPALQSNGDVGKCYSGQAKKVLLEQGYAHATADLMRQLVEMLYMAAFHKLNHAKFTESDAEDVRQLVAVARDTFSMLPHAQARNMFVAYFHYLRKQKACKKEILHMINSLFNSSA